ncbi:thiamine biosynthesis protein [Bifidobacterium sp. DSM 109958]|uniref:Thiamine biosynthesis protein n=1 Tax=Bifidobacterium moraviense TaxID=2675323 RepID=A0A7Y0F3T8_9BIFI|nr:sulfur carrier protein ThiS [Bifidobacterium sp. DSM 109958]NMN00527.1 thiamine biosynthesis protein [Bifidobacterium sp. DSM 109958]
MIVNGESESLAEPMTVAAFVAARGLNPGRVAVEVNGRIVPRDARESVTLADTDTVEIVSFVQGG